MLCNLAALFQESAWTTPFLWRRIVAVQAVQRRLVLPNLLALVSSSHMPKRTNGKDAPYSLKTIDLERRLRLLAGGNPTRPTVP